MDTLELYGFRNAEDVSRFQITTDSVVGGRTEGAFGLKPYGVATTTAAPGASTPSFTSGCFQGIIDYRDDNPASRGGFASFRTKPDERIRDLSAFEGLEMRVKTDGRG